VAVATVLFPSLARLAARADMDGFAATVSFGLRQILFLLVPASAAAAVLANPIVRLLYQRGEFHANQTPVVAGALAAFSLGLSFNGMMLMLNRAFFSLQENWLPTLVALANLGLNAALDAAFYSFGTWGIPLSTSLVNIAGTAALLFFLRRRLGGLALARVAQAAMRIVLASAAFAGAAWGIWRVLDHFAGRSTPAQILSLGFGLLAGIDAYLALCLLLRVREIESLLSLRSRRRAR
jgi:putative peptidoglycan lipid II flippase